MDEMTTYAQQTFEAEAGDWERTRYLAWATLQSQSTKHLELTDIMKFPWENEGEGESEHMTDEQYERLMQDARYYEQMLINNK